jgi:hypothetical protein
MASETVNGYRHPAAPAFTYAFMVIFAGKARYSKVTLKVDDYRWLATGGALGVPEWEVIARKSHFLSLQ